MISRFWLLTIFVATACSSPSDDKPVSAVVENGKVVSIRINKRLLSDSPDSINVFLKGAFNPVLGEFTQDRSQFIFTPAVHFTAGQTYEVRNGEQLIGSVDVPVDTSIKVPALLEVYPSGDTIAENTLKMYFKFSESMREGVSSKHICVLRDGRDTMKGTFLDLQPELWNEDGTILTLWLDPGRIKRDLIPNKTLGNPLTDNSNYTLVVTSGWSSKAGKSTIEEYRKLFTAAGRDEVSPKPQAWKVQAPKSGTTEVLKITFGETLDYMLVLHAIHVIDPDGDPMPGEIVTTGAEQTIEFTPSQIWVSGTYKIEVEDRLEDPAGNNLSRLFDQDVTKATGVKPSKPVWIQFEVI